MSSGRRSNTVARPSGSRLVVTTPAGLWKSQRRVRSIAGSGLPSISMRSEAVTSCAGLSRRLPFKVTRPSAIMPSASRREAMPARARRLAMRIVPGAPSSPSASGRALRGLSPSVRGRRSAVALSWLRRP